MYGRETFLVRMADDSMSPALRAGDYAYVDPAEPAEPGRLVAIHDGERRHDGAGDGREERPPGASGAGVRLARAGARRGQRDDDPRCGRVRGPRCLNVIHNQAVDVRGSYGATRGGQ